MTSVVYVFMRHYMDSNFMTFVVYVFIRHYMDSTL